MLDLPHGWDHHEPDMTLCADCGVYGAALTDADHDPDCPAILRDRDMPECPVCGAILQPDGFEFWCPVCITTVGPARACRRRLLPAVR